LLLIFILVSVLCLTSCGLKNASAVGIIGGADGPTSVYVAAPAYGSSPAEESTSDYDIFIDLLAENEFDYTEEESVQDGFLSPVKRLVVFIGEDTVSVYEYATTEDMENDAENLDKSGSSVSDADKTVSVTWPAPLHFFKKDTIIINYLGEDEKILDFLKANYGEEFAGAGYEGEE
jgi:hypothetical protein